MLVQAVSPSPSDKRTRHRNREYCFLYLLQKGRAMSRAGLEETAMPPVDVVAESSMSSAMRRRLALRGSGETLLLLAASTLSKDGLIRLPYLDTLAPSKTPPSQSSPPPAAASAAAGPWGEWLRIMALCCSCSSGGDGHNDITPAFSAATNEETYTATSRCHCPIATVESFLGNAAAAAATAAVRRIDDDRSATAAAEQQQYRLIRLACRDMAESLLSSATRLLGERDWADWLKAPLIGAASQGDLDAVRLLLAAGAGGRSGRGIGAWMIPGGEGRTLLHAAASGGSAAVVEALLDAGAGVVVNVVARGCLRTRDGFSPFHVAAIEGSVPVALALARAGAAVRRRAPFRQSALHLAAATGKTWMVRALVWELRLPVAGEDDLGATALHAAAWHGEHACVRALLELGADVNARDGCGRTPLFQASKCGGRNGGGGCETIRELLRGGADVHARSEDGDTPLHVACHCGWADAVRLLLRHGADETARCDLGKTPGDVSRREALRAARRRRKGFRTADGGGGGCREDFPAETAEAIREALAAAPAGRAWRRRAWLAMLRARYFELGKNGGENGGGDDTATGPGPGFWTAGSVFGSSSLGDVLFEPPLPQPSPAASPVELLAVEKELLGGIPGNSREDWIDLSVEAAWGHHHPRLPFPPASGDEQGMQEEPFFRRTSSDVTCSVLFQGGCPDPLLPGGRAQQQRHCCVEPRAAVDARPTNGFAGGFTSPSSAARTAAGNPSSGKRRRAAAAAAAAAWDFSGHHAAAAVAAAAAAAATAAGGAGAALTTSSTGSWCARWRWRTDPSGSSWATSDPINQDAISCE
ncbi:unnamed protein product [Ectocarpus sp. CCAP 1310/34]|nr:unnamed protein product [Ectocarpus sp. CCAP 1310/34]